MLNTAILWPAIVQALLIFAIYVRLGATRSRAVRSGAVPSTDFAPWDKEPDDSRAARRHLANQFELPVLFFAVVGFLFLVDGVSLLELVLAWLFVAARIGHTVGALSGPLALRHGAFALAFSAVLALWIDLAVRLI
ncbi:MAPEG family protein [Prosthecomicrobium pneumaticum]|uniref:MAPEG family protein n=1 Tax=Prosthecomicrobium pneumaticum TaxID=81895 RepID=A0A7W9FQX1_9HYPH|nr:MAPEG family protein [Prosthecomicrobium pneumaticum]MBB5755239.1 hypothetical protein [Prosthecomicrobium pneumaticum]